MKKEEQKQLMDLDEGLLEDDQTPDFHRDEPVVHKPIQKQLAEKEIVQEEKQIEIPIVKEIEPEFAPTEKSVEIPVSDIQQLLKETAQEDLTAPLPEVVEPIMQEPITPVAPLPIKQEPVTAQEPIIMQEPVNVNETETEPEKTNDEDNTYSNDFPHLTNRMVNDINMMTRDAIDALAKDGDVHAHERPVQHMVSFRNKEDMESFKSRVINKGFVITKGEDEYDLIVLHISSIDEVKLVNHILYLADQAYAFNGEYRGWQSKVSY
ncbi:hypothetical protein D5266_06215 [bacterium c-19]|nr:hypothetical protein [bacterium c-19]